jgi:predicted  nucleic acid-binding Zn-ribbon protein
LKDRLRNLYELQLIDNQLDELEELRGDLPAEVNDLKNQIQTIQDQIDSKEEEKNESLEKRKENDFEIERLNSELSKFKSQLYRVRNNKEYDALTKEIDAAEEKIEKLTSENKALEDLVEQLKVDIADLQPELGVLNEELKEKEEELKKIIKANEREEAKLQDEREKIAAKVKRSDYNSYMRIRKAKGGKAVVTIVRSACSGCQSVVPPQRQLEIRQNRRIYSCEHCGRLFVSPHVAEEVEAKFSKNFK